MSGVEHYRARASREPASLRELTETGLLPADFELKGYRYTFIPGWKCAADPVEAGGRYFYIDTAGMVHVRADGPAGPDDPSL